MKSKLTLAATIIMLALTALLMTHNDAIIFQDKGLLTVKRDPSDADTIVFYWRNDIDVPMARRFEEGYRKWKGEGTRILIDLHSPGGAIAEGEQVIRVIEKMKRTHIVDTRVRNRRSCFSMCVPIFLHGDERIAAPGARFMFHEPTVYDFYTHEKVDQPKFERDRITAKYFNRYFVDSPIDATWRDRLAEEWKGKDVFRSGQELVDERSNIVTVLQ